MSFDLGRGRALDDAPGIIALTDAEYPPMPDDAASEPDKARIDPRAWFKVPEQPFEIEVGCGKGSFILEQSRREPGVNYLGIEWAREFYLYTADRLRRAQVSNVRMLRTDATSFLRWRCASGVARVVHLYFSDPWPKSRHHKNRVVQDRFLAEAWRILVPGGELRVVTDHDELWQWCEEHFARWTTPGESHRLGLSLIAHAELAFLRKPFVAPAWVGEGCAVGTNYEKKMCVGKDPHACVLVKQA